MRFLYLIVFVANSAVACTDSVCVLPADSLRFTQTITFDDLPSSPGVGREVTDIVVQSGASVGKYLTGQTVGHTGNFDVTTGQPTTPLTLQSGGKNKNLGLMRLWTTTILHGHGTRGFPHPGAIGEGVITVLFDRDQPAIGFDIRGGEGGLAHLRFMRRDGSEIFLVTVADLKEETYVFLRSGMIPDIAAVQIENQDPEGIGIDNIRFEFVELLG